MSSVALLTCDNIEGIGAKDCVYGLSLTGEQLLALAVRNLDTADPKPFPKRLLLQKREKTYQWIAPNKELSQYHPHDGMTLMVLQCPVPVAVLTTDGSKKKMMLDITQTVKELVPFVAEKLRLASSIGYSLFGIGPSNEHIPLNLDLSLPQQIKNYDQVFFKRRYFVFTKKQVADRASSLLVYNDVKTHMKEMDYPLTDEQRVEMAYWGLYVETSNSEELKRAIGALPDQVKKGVMQLWQTRKKQPTKEEAVSEYLRAVHTVEGFGGEKNPIKYAVGEDKKFVQADMFIGPQGVKILKDGEAAYVLPFYKIVSLRETSSGMKMKILKEKGEEELLKLHCKDPLELYTLVAGYVSIMKEIGAEVITDGFFKDEGMDGAGLSASQFKEFYSPQPDGSYITFPGSLTEFKAIIDEVMPTLETSFPVHAKNLKKYLDAYERDMFDQESMLNLIFVVNELMQDASFAKLVNMAGLEKAIFKLSTVNITVGAMENIAKLLETLLVCQKVIRAEIMVKVEGRMKGEIDAWAKCVKKATVAVQQSAARLKLSPTNGQALIDIQAQLMQLYDEMGRLAFFAEEIVAFSPGSSVSPAIDFFQMTLRDTLRPLIPSEPPMRLRHVFHMQVMLFAVSVVLAAGEALLSHPTITSKEEIFTKLKEVLLNLGDAYTKTQDVRILLTVRPFSIPFLERARESMVVLQRALLNCKPTADLIYSVTGEEKFQSAIAFAKGYLNDSMKLVGQCRAEPYREVPNHDQVKLLHDSLVDTISKFLSHNAKLANKHHVELYEKIKGQAFQLKTIVVLMKRQYKAQNRSIFIAINKSKAILDDVMEHIRELSTILADASLFHYFNNILKITEKILENHVPNFQTFHGHIDAFADTVRNVIAGDLVDPNTTLELLDKFRNSPFPDRQIETVQMIRKLIADSQTKSDAPVEVDVTGEVQVDSKAARLKNALELADLVMICINQLPVRDNVAPPALMLIPFFKGKTIPNMVVDFCAQIDDVARFFGENSRAHIFRTSFKYKKIMEYWEDFFSSASQQIAANRNKEIPLLIKLKELERTHKQIEIFSQVVEPWFTDSEQYRKQFKTFFANCKLIISLVCQPHVADDDTKRFSELILPQIQKALQQISRASTSTPEIMTKLKQLSVVLSNGIADVNSGEGSLQQQFADNSYESLNEVLPLITDPSLNEVHDVLLQLKNRTAEFTARSLKSSQRSASKFFSALVASAPLEVLFDDMMKWDPSHDDPVVMASLRSQFTKLGADPESLPVPVRTAVAAVASDAQNFHRHAFTILRCLVEMQSSSEVRNAQLRRMSIEFAMRAIRLAVRFKEGIGDLKRGEDNPRMNYCQAHTVALMESFDPNNLLESRSFASLAMAYEKLKDVRDIVLLYLRESKNENMRMIGAAFIHQVAEMEVALSLDFMGSVEPIIKVCSSVASQIGNPQVDAALQAMAPMYQDEMLLLSVNFGNLGQMVRHLETLEQVLLPAVTDKNVQERLTKLFQGLNEFKLIGQRWTSPISATFEEEATKVALQAQFFRAASSMNGIQTILNSRILAMPLFVSPIVTALAEAMPVIAAQGQVIPAATKALTDFAPTLANIKKFCALLGDLDLAYKGDRGFQRCSGDFQRVVAYLFNESEKVMIDYSKLPKNIGLISKRLLEMVLTAVGSAPAFRKAKEFCDHVMDLFNRELLNRESAKAFSAAIELIPVLANMSLEEVQAYLAQAVKALSDEIATNRVTHDSLLTASQKILAGMVCMTALVKDETNDALKCSAVSLTDLFNDLAHTDKIIGSLPLKLLDGELAKLLEYLLSDITSPAAYEKVETKALVELVTSLRTNDPNRIYKAILVCEAVHAAAVQHGIKDSLVEKVVAVLDDCKKAAAEGIKAGQLSQQGVATAAATKEKVIALMTEDAMKIVGEIDRCNNIPDMIDLRAERELMQKLLVTQSDDFSDDGQNRILGIACTLEVLGQRGVFVKRDLSSEYCMEFIKLFNMSIVALNRLFTEKSKGSLRTFRRYNANIGDLIDDLYLEGDKVEQLGGIKEEQRQLLHTLAQVLVAIAKVNVARANAKVPETHQLVQRQQLTAMTELMRGLNDKLNAICRINTKEGLSAAASNQARTMYGAVSTWERSLATPAWTGVIAAETPLTNSVFGLANSIMEMTDVVPMQYEPEKASKLPPKFRLPAVPPDAAEAKPQDVAARLVQAIDSQAGAVQEMKSMIVGTASNDQLMSKLVPFYEKMTSILEDSLKLSVCSVDMNNQMGMTAAATSLAKSVDLMNKGIKAKFLATPSWRSDADRGISDVPERLAEIKKLAEEAKKFAQEEATKNSALREKIFAVLNPLKELVPKLSANQDTLNQQPPSTEREFALSLVGISSSATSLMCKVLLHAKNQGKEGPVVDEAIKFGRELLAIIEKVVPLTTKVPPVDETRVQVDAINDWLKRFGAGALQITTEGTMLKDQFLIITNGAQTLQATIKKAIEAPRSKVNSTEEHNRLMKRLELESLVNKHRFNMEFLEKEMATLDAA